MDDKSNKFIKLCTTITQEELLERIKNYGYIRIEEDDDLYIICCPSDIGLKEFEVYEDNYLYECNRSECDGIISNCINCWKCAINELVFKKKED